MLVSMWGKAHLNSFFKLGSTDTLSAVMRRMKVPAVPHGFRATFATWAQEQTSYPSDVRERALAHTVGSKTTAAYERGDQFEKRVQLMADWAAYIASD
jgi:integrase